MTITLLHGDNTEVLPALPAQSVQTVVTSPPYYALRDYGLPPTLWPTVEYIPMAGLPSITIPGCDPDCQHEWGAPLRAPWANRQPGPNGRVKNTEASRSQGKTSGDRCQLCAGWRGALGLEPDPLAYIAHLVHVFRLVWRVLRDDGTLWLNLGDSYSAGGNGGGGNYMAQRSHGGWQHRADKKGWRSPPDGLKEKDLLGIPWRVAYALQADGWYLRSDVIWSKQNCMPESVTDRPTRAHEYMFLLAKSERYFYNADAVREPYNEASLGRYQYSLDGTAPASRQPGGDLERRKREAGIREPNPLGRNRRTVWHLAARGGGDGVHFATFPESLVEPCILAGSRPGDTVLDPYSGTGTVARVAERFGRNAIGIELNSQYLELSDRRTDNLQIEMTAYL
jgi:DNA modification methylase